MTRYYVRLDDACPEMDHAKWGKILDILKKYGIKPMIGIIPENQDKDTRLNEYKPDFWKEALEWQKSGYALALHGFDHVCVSNSGGMNPVHQRSEFAGLPLEVQREKISRGYAVLKGKGIEPRYFFAPSHTFDRNTLKALESETPIRIVSDTMALKPYRRYGFTFIPQQMGKFRKVTLPGEWTFCYHPNTMTQQQIDGFERFISENRDMFHSFDEMDLTKAKSRGIIGGLMSMLYFMKRKLK